MSINKNEWDYMRMDQNIWEWMRIYENKGKYENIWEYMRVYKNEYKYMRMMKWEFMRTTKWFTQIALYYNVISMMRGLIKSYCVESCDRMDKYDVTRWSDGIPTMKDECTAPTSLSMVLTRLSCHSLAQGDLCM